MKASVIVFPASNCDRDAAVALEQATGARPAMVWHGESELPQSDLIVLPGGFSYGDYLRSGAMAARSPIMAAVIEKAKAGTPVIGIERLPVEYLIGYLANDGTVSEFVDEFSADRESVLAVLHRIREALAEGWLAERVDY